jgi:AcrR family transcriptional regulator
VPGRHGLKRRAEIIRTTGSIVREMGFADIRLTDIAERLDMSAGALVYHFETKDELLACTLEAEADDELDRVAEVLRTPSSAHQRIDDLVEMSLGTDTIGDWALWVAAWAEAIRSDRMRQSLERLDRRWLGAVAAVIRDGQSAGEFTPGDPRRLADAVLAIIDGLGVQLTLHPTQARSKRSMLTARTAIAAVLAPAVLAPTRLAPTRLAVAPGASD